MIKEAYVSFEVAKLLNERGFIQETLMVYNQNGNFMPNGAIEDTYQVFYSAPTHQMAMAWLREVHHIAINIGWGEVFEEQYHWWSIVLNMDNGNILYDGDYCASYEETVESTLKYCLENLI